jgi:F420-non-reducing hydrogenase iron-sulfur subunit
MDSNPTKIVIYHCRNLSIFKDGEQKRFARTHLGVKLTAVPCSGKVEAYHILNTLAGGADGVFVAACAEPACRYLEGSKRSNKRADYARTWLEELGVEPQRVRFLRVPPQDIHSFEKLLKEFEEDLNGLGRFPTGS